MVWTEFPSVSGPGHHYLPCQRISTNLVYIRSLLLLLPLSPPLSPPPLSLPLSLPCKRLKCRHRCSHKYSTLSIARLP